ncbi:MAG: dihydrofolate reductase family protein [Helicobacteraceae bacterium]|jgi:dihydrofolate reductase|nr:dihydrofolate reductase family protein [Helicobacteraceae bacterium]
MRISVFIATSLDGYIAKPDGNIDWLMEKRYKLEGEDFGYSELYDACDLLVMGRNSYEKVASFDEWPYPGKRVIILSRSLETLPEPIGKVELFGGSVSELMETLRMENKKYLYIDGGQVIQSFLKEGVVTDITITTIPILLGEGIRLFGTLPKEKNLKLIAAQGYENGFVQSRYEVVN